jgi:hypothetical protein
VTSADVRLNVGREQFERHTRGGMTCELERSFEKGFSSSIFERWQCP